MNSNPYAKFLGESDPVEVMGRTVGAVRKLLERMPEEQLRLCAPGKRWNAREIVCHLGDCEMVFGFRLRQTLAEDGRVLQPFNQERWALRYANCDAESAMQMFEAMRNWNLLLIESASATERARRAMHPERGTMNFWTIVETIAGHDINHLGQLERMAAG